MRQEINAKNSVGPRKDPLDGQVECTQQRTKWKAETTWKSLKKETKYSIFEESSAFSVQFVQNNIKSFFWNRLVYYTLFF